MAGTTPVFRKLGPGTLKFGATGSAKEFGIACKKVELTPEMKDEEQTDLLDGSAYKPEGAITGAISGTLLQQYDADSLLAWTWEQAGKTMPFEFTPSAAGKMKITGSCQITPMKVGGDVGKVNDSDFNFPLVGSNLPTMTLT